MLAFKKAPQIWPSLPPASLPLNVNDWEINERRFIGHSFNGSNYSRLMDYSGSVPCFPSMLFWPWDELNILLKLSVKKATVMGRIMVRSLWWWQKETCGGVSACGLDLVRLELHDGLLYLLEWYRETPWGHIRVKHWRKCSVLEAQVSLLGAVLLLPFCRWDFSWQELCWPVFSTDKKTAKSSVEAGRQSSKLGIGNWMPSQLNKYITCHWLGNHVVVVKQIASYDFFPRMNGNVTLMKKIVHLFIFSNCLFTTVHIIMDDKAMPFLFLCGRLHLPNWCYFGDVFNGRILRPLPPTSESVLIPWPIPRSSSLFFLPFLCAPMKQRGM